MHMCCCKRLETSCEALISDPVVLVLSSGSRSNPRFFGQLVYSPFFFVGGFGLASAPASPVSSQHEVIFKKKKTASRHLNASADAYMNVQTPPPKVLGVGSVSLHTGEGRGGAS